MKTMLKFNPCHRVCPLYRGWPLLGGSVMGSSTVNKSMMILNNNCHAYHIDIIYMPSLCSTL